MNTLYERNGVSFPKFKEMNYMLESSVKNNEAIGFIFDELIENIRDIQNFP